jgi:hypothetical protein
MMQPACCLCGEKIKANEHYFIFHGGRSVCMKCGRRIRHDKNNRSGIVCNSGTGSADE